MKLVSLLWIAVLICCGCRGPLGPGETRCTSRNVFGTQVTDCKTGQDAPAPVAQPVYYAPPAQPAVAPAPVQSGWWCTVDGEYGLCFRDPGPCEAARYKYNDKRLSDDRSFGACFFQAQAICSGRVGCYSNPSACASVERREGYDGAGCMVVR